MTDDKSEQSSPANIETKKPCRACGELIKASAIKCIHCDSYQNWRRYIDVSSTVLALLVALLSVATVAVPAILQATQKPTSRISIAKQTFQNNSLFFVVANSGTRPAIIDEAKVSSRYFPAYSLPVLNIRLDSDSVYIPPGIKRVGFPVRFFASAEHTGRYEILMRKLVPHGDSIVGSLLLRIMHFDGRKEEIEFKLTRQDMSRILISHAYACFQASKNHEPLSDECGALPDDDLLADLYKEDRERTDHMLDEAFDCLEAFRYKRPLSKACRGPEGWPDGPIERLNREALNDLPFGTM